jgi:hypothetical protein
MTISATPAARGTVTCRDRSGLSRHYGPSNLLTNVIGIPPGKDTVTPAGRGRMRVIFAFNQHLRPGRRARDHEGDLAGEAIRHHPDRRRGRCGISVRRYCHGNDTNTGAAMTKTASPRPLFIDSKLPVTVSVLNNTAAPKRCWGWIDFDLDGIFESSRRWPSTCRPTPRHRMSSSRGHRPQLTAGQSLRLRLSETLLTGWHYAIDERSAPTTSLGHGEVEDYALSFVGASITGTVYQDTNSNGTLTGGELGTAVLVSLTGTDILGNAVSLWIRLRRCLLLHRPAPQRRRLHDHRDAACRIHRWWNRRHGGTVDNAFGADTITIIVIPDRDERNRLQLRRTAHVVAFGHRLSRPRDNNGAINGGENGIGSVNALTGTDAFGQAVARAWSRRCGHLLFANLRPGTTRSSRRSPALSSTGVRPSARRRRARSTTRSTATRFRTSRSQNDWHGQSVRRLPPSLAGSVYGDLDADGVFDALESGISA